MKKLYISGPITGQPFGNRPAFDQLEAVLRRRGYDVCNPHALAHVDVSNWEQCMRLDVVHLLSCDGIVMLPGWERSRGARLELHIAAELGLRVFMSVVAVPDLRPAEAHATPWPALAAT
jgi:hypothetical protein